MAEAGDEPAKASRTAHFSHVDAMMLGVGTMKKTQKSGRGLGEGYAGATTPTMPIPVAGKAVSPVGQTVLAHRLSESPTHVGMAPNTYRGRRVAYQKLPIGSRWMLG